MDRDSCGQVCRRHDRHTFAFDAYVRLAQRTVATGCAGEIDDYRAPLHAVDGMKRGSIIIDLAGATGGNCALSEADVSVEREGVTIVAPTNLPATVPVHASQ